MYLSLLGRAGDSPCISSLRITNPHHMALEFALRIEATLSSSSVHSVAELQGRQHAQSDGSHGHVKLTVDNSVELSFRLGPSRGRVMMMDLLHGNAPATSPAKDEQSTL